jgi:dTDP-4-amino-4,6-dideoxygalactose transaminase
MPNLLLAEDASMSSAPRLCAENFKRSLIGAEERDAAMRAIDRAIENKSAFDRYGGEEVDAYEREFAAHMGTRFATAVSSGTAAVHTALAALDLEPGSEVICPPISDPGGIGPVLSSLCIPVFADTDPESFNVSAASVESKITSRTRAIMVAHIAGEPCDMEAIMSVASKHGLPVVEDSAQAHGATWGGGKAGSFGTLGAFSLMSGKHHTSGGQGGMVVTNDEALYWRAKSFADRGKGFGRPDVGGFLGLNYRMTELEAAIGRVQLRRLPGFIRQRQDLAGRLEKRLAGSRLFALGWLPAPGKSSYWFLRIRVHLDRTTGSKEEIAAALRERGLPAAPTYTSIIYSQPWFKNKRTFGRSEIPWSLPQCQHVPDYEHCAPNSELSMANHLLIAFNESLSMAVIEQVADAMLEVEQEFLRR